MLQSGASLLLVNKRLGHGSIATSPDPRLPLYSYMWSLPKLSLELWNIIAGISGLDD
jgi:hypothetical protein